MIVLLNDRLKVEIAEPGSVYRGTRFDWSGFITQITLDGKHTFCQPESLVAGQGTGGIGLCNEFAYDKTLGYDDAKPGELFPKPGIGLLKKPDEAPYLFMRPYEIVELFPIHVDVSATMTAFTVEPIECRGYAVNLVKRLRLEENKLRIEYQLQNTGSKPIISHEYCHNFTGIDSQPLGTDYTLSFPYRLELEDMSPGMVGLAPFILRKILPKRFLIHLVRKLVQRQNAVLDVRDRQVGLRFKPANWFIIRLAHFEKSSQPQWELLYKPSGVGMREFDDFNPARVVVWGTTHVISAEIFVDIHLLPGETQTWMRCYEFYG